MSEQHHLDETELSGIAGGNSFVLKPRGGPRGRELAQIIDPRGGEGNASGDESSNTGGNSQFEQP